MAVRMSKLNNVTLFRLALGDKDSVATLYLSKHPSMHSTVLKKGYKQVNIPCVKLDSLVKITEKPDYVVILSWVLIYIN
jgi:hypothetical protein